MGKQEDQITTKISKGDRVGVLIAANLATWGIGLVAVFCSAWLVWLQLGPDAWSEETAGQDLFWLTVWCVVLCLSCIQLFARSKKPGLFLRTFRKVFLVYVCLGLVGGLVASAAVSANRNSKNAAECSLETTLNGTLNGSLYPIRTDQGSGTAFAIKDDGTLLTAYHVVESAKEVYVSFTTGRIPVNVIDVAPEYDLALLKIERQTPQFIKLTDTYKVADTVYAVGWPGNAFTAGGASVSQGIISRILSGSDLRLSDQSTPDGLRIVQTDAAVNPGNSGGPLIGACGVVGVVDAISDRLGLQEYGTTSEDGISYAISTQTIRQAFGL